jgi:cysteine desulfurase
MIYLDYNATAPVRPSVIQAVTAAMRYAANPSSIHQAGEQARTVLEKTRQKIATFVAAQPHQVLFTSGASESNNWILKSFAHKPVLVSAIEHDSILKAHPNAIPIPVTHQGVVDIDVLQRLLHQERPALVSVMLANNETGIIQPLGMIAALAHEYGADVHTDAVQAFGKMPVSFQGLNVDHMTISTHKVGGVVGFGALITNAPETLKPLIEGGHQEKRFRAGTENIPAIAGVAALLDDLLDSHLDIVRLSKMRHRLEEGLIQQGGVIFGRHLDRICNTTLVAMPEVPSETQVLHFDLMGIAVSAGAACTSSRIESSHVLKAMGIDPRLSNNTIRFSLGFQTTDHHIDAALDAWTTLRHRSLTRLAA